jgi:hypothetical protein
MNKQLIYDLAVKHKHICGELPLNSVEELTLVGLELFAEVIVQECITVARGADGLDATHEAWYLIKQHFGVEE